MTRAELIQIIKATRPADLLGAVAIFAALFAALILTGV